MNTSHTRVCCPHLRIKDADDILTAIADLYADSQKVKEMQIEALLKEAADLKKPPADKK